MTESACAANVLGLLKGVEDALQCLRRNADAGVADSHPDPLAARARAGDVFGAHGHFPALGGELGGIVQEVPEDLLEAPAVADDVMGSGFEVAVERDAAVAQIGAAGVAGATDEVIDVGTSEVKATCRW